MLRASIAPLLFALLLPSAGLAAPRTVAVLEFCAGVRSAPAVAAAMAYEPAPLRVPAPGRYLVRVRRPDFEDFIARLEIAPEARVEVTPTLGRQRQDPRWYDRWWVWALVDSAVAASSTAAVIGAVAQKPNSVPAVVRGLP